MSAHRQPPTSTSAKILYKPVGIVSGLLAGAIASQIFHLIWAKSPISESEESPTALESDYDMKEILVAAAIQGAIYSVVKALVARGGARGFQKATGEWPGE